MRQYEDNIYIACNIGIVKYDFNRSEWDLIINSVQYQNKNIFSLEINRKNIYLGTDDGIMKINYKTGHLNEYSFPFIGRVNQMIIIDNFLWAGTSNGLLKFKWKTGI
jgi:ligand-binding sensor domain-containing protein